MRSLSLLLLAGGCSLAYPVGDLTSGDPAEQPGAMPELITGAQQTAIVLASSVDPQRLREEVFGETSRFISEASYGRTWIEGEMYGPIDVEVEACGREMLAAQADEVLRRAGIELRAFEQVVYVHRDIDCPSAMAWNVEQRRGWMRDDLPAAAWGHLWGHLLGLGHAKSCDCGGAVLQPLTECALNDSFDLFDVMGTGTEDPSVEEYRWGHPHLAAKEQLGWLDRDGTPSIVEVTASGRFAIEALETQTSGAKGLRIARAIPGVEQWFYVELRKPIGFDARAQESREYGVVVHMTTLGGPALLDASPRSRIGPRDWIDASLDAGQSFFDPLSGTVITAAEIGDEQASIDVVWRSPEPGPIEAPLREELDAWPLTVRPGDVIVVDFDASKIRTSEDWIGMYLLDGSAADAQWVAPTQGRASGTVFAQALEEGTYEFRYYRGSDPIPLVTSNPISVVR